MRILAVLCIGGWIVAAIGLYCAHFNARLALRWKAMWTEASRQTEDAIGIAKEAIARAESHAAAGDEEADRAN